ncbi:hypothetical protein BDZ97DRAFT_1764561 [Flammula alnicola]|nr:hypothetical protein BDZ97DRAFT_1764561 [Flammula alnicola]
MARRSHHTSHANRTAHERDEREEEEREEEEREDDGRGGIYRRATQATRGRRLAPWRLQTSTPQEQPPCSPCLTANPKHDADAAGARDDEDDGHRVTTPRVPEPAASYKWPRNANLTTDAGDTTIPLLCPPGPIDLGFDDTSPPPITANPRWPR